MKIITRPFIKLEKEEIKFLDELSDAMHAVCCSTICGNCPFKVDTVVKSSYCPIEECWFDQIVTALKEEKGEN